MNKLQLESKIDAWQGYLCDLKDKTPNDLTDLDVDVFDSFCHFLYVEAFADKCESFRWFINILKPKFNQRFGSDRIKNPTFPDI